MSMLQRLRLVPRQLQLSCCRSFVERAFATAGGRERGTVVRWDSAKGFGFIRPFHGQLGDIFCHFSALQTTLRQGRPSLAEGDSVDFVRVKDNRRRGKFRARDVMSVVEAEQRQSGKADRRVLLHRLRNNCRRPADVRQCLKNLVQLQNNKEYSMAIAAWGRLKQPEPALELLEEMRRRGVEPDDITFSAAISACALGGAERAAGDLFLEARSKPGIFQNLWVDGQALYDVHKLPVPVAKVAVASVLEDIRLRPRGRHVHEASKDLAILAEYSSSSSSSSSDDDDDDSGGTVICPAILDYLHSAYPELSSAVKVEHNEGAGTTTIEVPAKSLAAWAAAAAVAIEQ